MKKIFLCGKAFFLLSFLLVGACDKNASSMDAEANISYRVSNEKLIFDVRLMASKSTHLSFYEDIENNIRLSVLPNKIQGRESFVLSKREGKVSSVDVGPSDEYGFTFWGEVVSQGKGAKVDFGKLGFITLDSLDDEFSIGVVLFPENYKDLKSDDGIISNYITVSIRDSRSEASTNN